ncbi:DapH/DapD/GlmU-related protein [Bacillus suaedaesalsae]|uniref:Acetyltransferase n=1 Tax=Bacillus suaedaesalsae TaxID=2810349 RepID=A0ABS2DIL2_9BACI|nr:DapH/DapD/GlmU-related protein [Bacillus suaedaesalsae]MBM6618226.1 hypothetical protein [Bacillus suaedaesalsae]
MNLYVVGLGYFDFKLIDSINEVNPTWSSYGYLSKRKIKRYKNYSTFPIIGSYHLISELAKGEDNYFINNKPKDPNVTRMLLSKGCKIPTLIHPSIDMNMVKVGQGVILPQGCSIGQNTTIGNYVTLRMNCLISHDVKIEDNVFIGAGATIGGRSTLKKNCYIGLGAVVMGVTIGENSVVGAGAVVVNDVPPNTVVVGVPAKPLKKERGEE